MCDEGCDFAIPKKYLVARGKNIDLSSLIRNIPGRIVLVNDPEKDIVEIQWSDVRELPVGP